MSDKQVFSDKFKTRLNNLVPINDPLSEIPEVQDGVAEVGEEPPVSEAVDEGKQ